MKEFFAHVKIRDMHNEDVHEVYQIETAGKAFPWSIELIRQELVQGQVAEPLVAIVDTRIAGFIMAWYVADEVHLVNIVVHPDFQRQGIATKLLQTVFSLARQKGCQGIYLEVRRSNFAAISLYKKLGFIKTGIRPQYYRDTFEDALLMKKNLT